MLTFYKIITSLSAPFLSLLLAWRQNQGKEDKSRINERMGQALLPRPNGSLIWIHAASVGEAQSALILIKEISITDTSANFLVTSGTKTSAELMAQRLPSNAIHQYYPLDHPIWVQKFLNHWKPDLVLWMESELWPNMLSLIRTKNIPAVLVNARLSDRSFKRWNLFRQSAETLLSTFNIILAQTDTDKTRFEKLGHSNIFTTDNLKHSAAPLPYNSQDLEMLQKAIHNRPVWLYASTHHGEETLAARIHRDLSETYPNLLTIIVPRHPERRETIRKTLVMMGLNITLRGTDKNPPRDENHIYVVDTLGELGLFYRLSPIAVIGRSFSLDGGGGHNPIEAAQLDCAVLTGPHIQYQKQLFSEMFTADAAAQVQTEEELLEQLKNYLNDKGALDTATRKAKEFSKSKDEIIHNVMDHILPLLPPPQKEAA
ncbi:MAG TPA: 3-deoxy-D-manno-octulosonic acid transferase [Alphaproteobacteria bacterium]|nr:3-deoxy-D-manno-octulosonic acid transferase [Alphaproteobacteria bacterium]